MKLTTLPEHLTHEENLFAYTLAGILAGALSSLVITAFKGGFELPAQLLSVTSFESLPPLVRLLLPIGGALILGLVFHWFKLANTRTGLPHTVHIVNKAHAQFPLRSLLAQFFGGIIALASGQSVGQEGPAVHLGAGSCALAGQRVGVPTNGLRILAGCGTAAAIAAAFNTPLAGVIFAMEVVLMEYTIAGFVPIIMAAVTATVIQRFIGDYPLSDLANYSDIITAGELIWLLAMAFTAALASTAFVHTSRFWLQYSNRPVITRFLVAGCIVGVLSLAAPQIMGTGGDTLRAISHGDIGVITLALIVAAKIVATGSAVGLGIPGGLIGPSLIIGAAVGGLFAGLADHYFPGFEGVYTLYVLLGMAAMMSAAINAPLAAIIFIVELSFSSSILLPGLLVVVLANLFHQSLLGQPSLAKLIFDHLGLEFKHSAASQTLSHKNVMSLMNTSIIATQTYDFTALAEDYDFALIATNNAYELVDLSDANFTRHRSNTIATTASLMEAWQSFQLSQHDYLLCTRKLKQQTLYIGVLRRQDIVDYLLK